MAREIVHLPNGQTLTITPVFGGLFFKSNDLSNHHSPFPAGWTIILNSEDQEYSTRFDDNNEHLSESERAEAGEERRFTHRYMKPTLQGDHLYISSISNPSNSDFKPAGSPTRQIAMMLWATLWWYFHQSPPKPQKTTRFSENTAEEGRPKGEWRININREGIFKGKVLLPKLERMGLIASEDSYVGYDQDHKSAEGWTKMFVSRRSFWQLDPRIYLFTLNPIMHSPYPSGSPYSSRPNSPVRGEGGQDAQAEKVSQGLWSPTSLGPFRSTSHLPTYYPPPPPQYIFSNGTRHPIRPKPPRQGETFYTRYIPSVNQYLSFRVACLSPQPLRHKGPVSSPSSTPAVARFRDSQISQISTYSNSDSAIPGVTMTDVEYLHKWMNDERVAHFWGEQGPQSHQEDFLRNALKSRHSIPVIGCWDGKPFGYFEIYWVKEDVLGRHLGNSNDYDRGFHCLVGEEEFRGPQRVRVWLSAMVHYCWLADNRTETAMLEPRVDNVKLAQYLTEVGFYKEREVSFSHKQANVFKIRREAWEAPEL